MSGKGTPFGAFLDSTLDRIEEGIVLAAVAVYFSGRGMDFAVGATQDASGPGFVRLCSGAGTTFVEVPGTENDEAFGFSVAAAGDSNRDGIPDVVAGAPD